LGLNWTKISNIGTKLNIEHWLWHVAGLTPGHFKKIFKNFKKHSKKFKKIFKKTTKWHVAVNDLNRVSKKWSNWIKLTKIMNYLNTTPKLGLIWQNLKGIIWQNTNNINMIMPIIKTKKKNEGTLNARMWHQ